MKYYLAGGAVRNLLLGVLPSDLDFVFTGSIADFIHLNPEARKLGGGPAFELNKHEYTELGAGISENLQQRDITINSFLLEENGVLHMHPRAMDDLLNKVISPASNSSFADDPLRVFRAARFWSVLPEFSLSAEAIKMMKECGQTEGFTQIAPDRIGQECQKALCAPKPGNFIRALGLSSCLAPWFTELSGSHSIPAGPVDYHDTDVLEHIARTMDKAKNILDNWLEHTPHNLNKKAVKQLTRLTVWMSLCHDLGKVTTPSELLPHHYQHESRGAGAAINLGTRLKLPARLISAGAAASRLHMKAGIYHTLRQGTRVDLLIEAAKKDIILPLFLLAQADSGNNTLLELAEQELKVISQVTLPEKWKNQGKASGAHLREMRCAVLPRHPSKQK